MTYEQKLRENKRLLENYVAFLSECTTYEDRLKLSSEIGRLNDQNKQIEKMEYQYTKKDISDTKIETNAIFWGVKVNPVEPLNTFKRKKDKVAL
ncbi:hypothetical protein ML462_13955 [Gramella lutea]|uniref:Uncharacterized protein n=1 Tax=Christiangramia lutea TaxID=1607951 RepID=A0A9X2AAA9_9FLAO|nr:hypothetical protein [Christiangramia lutea]MCH4824275.1 hypothetical protein [Christiangramia lutea]